MVRRRIGRERLALGDLAPRGGTALDEAAALLDWAEPERLPLLGIPASAKGEPGWPPLALSRALPLAAWHDRSDVSLAGALDDRASFRRSCGFAARERTPPERAAFVRFRAEPVRRGLDRALSGAATRPLDRRGLVVRTGTPVDATLIPSASVRQDGEARRAGHRRREPAHGHHKARVATDQAAGLTRGVEVTTAGTHDAADLDSLLPEAPGDACGDGAFAGTRPEAVIRARGGRPRVVHAGAWGGAEAGARLAPGWRPTMPRCAGGGLGSRRSSAP
jgi:IS5 family transposase